MLPPNVMRLHRLSSAKPNLQDKDKALKYICRATTSLPVVTIATRDRVEAEMLARRRADLNRASVEQNLESGASISPGPLDTTV